MFCRFMITTKMLLVSIVTLALVMAAGIAVIGWQSSKVTHDLSVQEAKAIAKERVAEVRNTIEYGLVSAQNMTYALASLKRSKTIDRAQWSELLKSTLEKNAKLSGTWGVVAEDALDGRNKDHVNADYHDESGEWRPYFFRNQDGSIGFRTMADLEKNNYQALWFRGAYDSGKPFVTEPYSWDMGGSTVVGVSLTVPVKNPKGETIGVAGTDIMLVEISEALGHVKPLGTGSIHLLSKQGKWVAHPDNTLLGKAWQEGRSAVDLEHEKDMLAAIEKGQAFEYHSYSKSLDTDVLRIIEPITIGDTGAGMALVVNVPVKTLSEASNQIMMSVLMVGAALLVTIAAVLFFVGQRMIATPMRNTISSIDALVNRQYDAPLRYLDRQDEIGQINQALEVFREKSQEAEQLASTQELEQQNRMRRAEKMQSLTREFDGQIGGLLDLVSGSVSGLNQTSDLLTRGADSTSQQSNAVAAASEQASSNVRTVASAAEELFSSVNEIDRQVGQSNQIAANAVDQARQTNDKIEGLSSAASRIGEVVKLITDIAEQTNLLALNATIEAARAGDAGRGFAVVAAEVKELATQTSKATDEISQQIQAVQTETNGAVDAIRGIADTIEQMNQISASISDAVQQQGQATQEIARNIQEASAGTMEVSTNIVGVSTSATETGDAARKVAKSAGDLQREAENLRKGVQSFLTDVRNIA